MLSQSRTLKGALRCSLALRCERSPPSSSTSSISTSPPTPPSTTALSLKERQLRDAEERAGRFGFMKRKGDFNSQVWMQSHFQQGEVLPSGIRVYNLPPSSVSAESGENGELKQYVKSTTDFMSQVTPDTTVGVGLGAGFGQRPDKRLGWLRPRQKDHLTPLPPDEEKEMMLRKVEEEGIQNIPEAKTPEERKEQIQRLLTYMKSFEGTTMSGTGGHSLLADLDFEKDSLLFGRTRDEFVHNVDTLKRVILNYEKWERTDNGFRYGTILIQFCCVWLVIDCIQTLTRFQLLQTHFDDFVGATDEELVLLKTRQTHDKELARLELVQNPPNYDCVLEQIVQERNAVRAKQQNQDKAQEQLQLQLLDHPMDTTKDEATRRAERDERQRRDMQIFVHNELADSSEANINNGKGSSTWRRIWHKLGSAVGLKKNKNQESSIDQDVGHVDEHQWAITADDVARYSYAVAPTSISTVRALRRVLLPRSDDYTQVVREEMAAYQLEKDTATGYKVTS